MADSRPITGTDVDQDLSCSTDLAEVVAGIARRAGAAIMEVYASADLGVTTKADASPLTQADLRAHRVIVAGLRDLTPEIPVLSEEAADVPFSERRHWARYWLVDPLDGTKEFVSRNGQFTVNIALVEQHQPALGVVYVPARDTLYWGCTGLGAYRCVGMQPGERITVRSPTASPVRVVGSRSHRGDSLDSFLGRLGRHELIAVGSAVKFCMIAEGSADVYPRLGPTSQWDTAAAHAVLVAAGGTVVTTQGGPLVYNTKAELLNPHFIAYGDTTRDWVGLLQ